MQTQTKTETKQTNRSLYYGSRKAGLKTSILKHSNTITLPNKVQKKKNIRPLQTKPIKHARPTLNYSVEYQHPLKLQST